MTGSGKESIASDELIHLMGAFSGAQDLIHWLISLDQMSEEARRTHLESLALGMEARHDRADLIATVRTLISPKAFRSAMGSMENLNR